jgi:protocatechuate 4,5-dioxygenase beta chain
MAKIIAGITTSHIPAVGNAIANKLQNEPYWKRFFDGYKPVIEWLEREKPDVVINVYNDHGLNFFLNAVPTFAIGCADVYTNDDEGWGLPSLTSFEGDSEFSWHLAESLINQNFDMTTCQEMKVDHGCVVPMTAMFGHLPSWPCKLIPLAVNTVQHPLPSAQRCYDLGKALRKAIESYPADTKVAIFGTGGLSHQLQGERAGIIDTDFDLQCIDYIINDPEKMTAMSNDYIMEKAGTEGIEVIMWMVMRGAMAPNVDLLHKHYHAPISNTGAGVIHLVDAQD